MSAAALELGLETLGAVLTEDGLQSDLVLVGGGALLLRGDLERPTADLDVIARVENGVLKASEPLPAPLLNAVRRVAKALDLPYQPRDQKDWLNAGPSYLTTLGLPDGFQSRLATRKYGALTIRIASRFDLVALKLFAASDPQRGSRRAIDLADLKRLVPDEDELLHALRWCMRIDGRPGFLRLDAIPLLLKLGVDPVPLVAELEHELG